MDSLCKQYRYTTEQKRYAWAIVQAEKIAGMRENSGGEKQVFAGVLAEIVMCDLMGIERKTAEDYAVADNGIDFIIGGKKIDLKILLSSASWKPYYSNNIIAQQLDFAMNQTEIYLFAVINPTLGTIQFNGWIKKIDIKQSWKHRKGTSRPRGKSEPLILLMDTYEIYQDHLKAFNPLVFASDMEMFDLTMAKERLYN